MFRSFGPRHTHRDLPKVPEAGYPLAGHVSGVIIPRSTMS